VAFVSLACLPLIIQHRPWAYGLIGAACYGGVATALSARRVVDPSLPPPFMVALLDNVLYLVGASRLNYRQEMDPTHCADEKPPMPAPLNAPMGRGSAIFWTVLMLILAGAALLVLAGLAGWHVPRIT
jgi:hypothetical protein